MSGEMGLLATVPAATVGVFGVRFGDRGLLVRRGDRGRRDQTVHEEHPGSDGDQQRGTRHDCARPPGSRLHTTTVTGHTQRGYPGT